MSTPETKTIKTRFQLKNDTPANWATASQNSFIPLQGEPILYKDGTSGEIYGMKVGDGTHTPDNLDFICDNTQTITVDTILSGTSTNPVQNKAIVNGLKDATICVFQSTGGFSVSLSYLTGFTCIDWGDDSAFTTTASHTYSSAGPFICKIYGMTSLPTNGFRSCTYLRQIYFGTGITTFNSDVFQYCSNLNTVVLSQNLTSIGYQGFYGCSKLKNIVIPKSVTSLSNQAFYGCTGLLTITFEGNTPPTVSSQTFTSIGSCVLYVPYEALSTYKSTQNYPTSIIHALLPDNSLGNGLELNSSNKIQAKLGNGLGFDANGAIEATGGGGISLTDIAGTDTVITVQITSANTTIDLSNDQLTSYNSIDWGDGTSDQLYSHTYTTANTYTIVIHGLANIDMYFANRDIAFQSAIRAITIGEGVTTIGQSAFNGCTGLVNVILPQTLTTIDYGAFDNCPALESIKLPPLLNSMSDGAFNNCSSLAIVEFQGVTPPSNLMDTPQDPLFPSSTTLIVPVGTSSAYNTAFGSLACAYTFTEYSLGGGGGGGGATWHYVGAASVTVSLTGACSVFTVCFRGGDAPSYDYFGTSTVAIVNSADPLEIRGTADGYGQYATAYGSNFDPDTSTYTEAVISVSSGATIQGYFSY